MAGKLARVEEGDSAKQREKGPTRLKGKRRASSYKHSFAGQSNSCEAVDFALQDARIENSALHGVIARQRVKLAMGPTVPPKHFFSSL